MTNSSDLTLEDRTHLLAGAESFASYVTEKWPQTNEDGKVNYYIGGSLAVMLLAQSDSFELLDTAAFPDVRPYHSIVLPEETRTKLTEFARKLGDFDFVITEIYKEALRHANSHFRKDVEKYRALRSKILLKGGGGPTFDELPYAAKDLFENSQIYAVMCDPVPSNGEHQVVRINVNGREYLISDPRMLLGYKALHIVERFHKNPEKMRRDFEILHDAFSQIYQEDELIGAAYQVIIAHIDPKADGTMPNRSFVKSSMEKLDSNPDFNSTVRQFFEKLRTYDTSHSNIL